MTYDEKQRSAVLVICRICQRAYYATAPWPEGICISCR